MAKAKGTGDGKGAGRKRPDPGDAADAVRTAVDRTFQATMGQAQVTRERAQERVDELSGAAGRVRSALESMRLASGEDVEELTRRLDELERRVAKLERAQRSGRAPAGGKPKA